MTTSAHPIVEIAGSPLPADVEALFSDGYVDDSQRLPDMAVLRFRDTDHIVISKGNATIGGALKVSVQTADAQSPTVLFSGEITALETSFDSVGTFTVIRGYDQAHRLFRGRQTYTYTQVTASDVAKTVAQRAGLSVGSVTSTSTVYDHLSQSASTDWEFLDGLARDVGFEITVRDGKFSFGPPKAASTAPDGSAQPGQDPLVLHQGTDLLRFRAVVTSAQQVKTVHVRGWDVASKKALVGTAPAQTTSAVLPGTTPADLAHAFGDPEYVATDVPFRSQSEVDAAAKALADQIAGSFAEVDAVARGNPKLAAGQAISVESLGKPFDGKYTISTSRHRFDPTTGYTTAFAVTGRAERSLRGLTAGGDTSTRPGVAIGTVSDANDPQGQGRVKLTFPWLSDDYVSDWARTVQLGAGKARGGMTVPEVGDEVLVAFEQADFRRPCVLGGLFNGVDTPDTGGGTLVDSGSGAINRRSIVSRRGHRIDLHDADGRTEGITLSTTGDKLKLELDAVGTKVTVHSDGTVLVEGKQGITIDSSSADLELKGGQIKVSATNGVSIDGGGGQVSVNAGTQLSLKGVTASLEGSGQTEVKGGAMCSISAALVKIN